MTRRGSLALGVATGALLLGSGWLLWEQRQLKGQIRDAQRHRAAGALSWTRPAAAPDRTGPGPAEIQAEADRTQAVAAQNSVNRIHDLAQLLDSGIAGQLRWRGWESRKIDEVVDAFATVVGLSSARVESLSQTIIEGRDAIAAGLASVARVSRPAENQVVIEFGETLVARNAAAALETALKEQLGEDAYAIYAGMGFRDAITTLLSNGALSGSTAPGATRTYTITRQGEGPKYTYSQSQRTTLPNGGGGGGGGGGGAGREYLEFNLGTAVYRLLPTGFEL